MNVVTLAIPASVLVSKSAHSESGADFGWVRTTRPARRRPTLLMVLVALRRSVMFPLRTLASCSSTAC